MLYQIIQPPFTLRFREMSAREAESYFNWFMGQLPTRIQVLEQAVRSTPGYQDWRADCTPDSLAQLGEWFCEHVETRERTEEEKEAIYSASPELLRGMGVGSRELTNQTFSLAIDIAMYSGEMLARSIPGSKWAMMRGPRNNISFHQPVLAGRGRLVLNPVQVMVTYAYGAASGTRGGESLRELYDIWVKKLAGSGDPA
jgi:hypothetical protein